MPVYNLMSLHFTGTLHRYFYIDRASKVRLRFLIDKAQYHRHLEETMVTDQ